MKAIDIQAIQGFRMGHAQHEEAGTGCTVIVCEEGAAAGVSVRGGSPGTRETDLLKSENLIERVHSVFLAGGSAFGLDVAGGIMEYLERKRIGFDVGKTFVPIVPGAILFDLNVGDAEVRPNQLMGYNACAKAFSNTPFFEGNVGAGTGASVGKIYGGDYSMKGGLGWAAVEAGDLQLGAIIAVNCFGDVIDPASNSIVAGAYNRGENKFMNSEHGLISQLQERQTNRFNDNTTIGTLITNAVLTKAQSNKLSSIGHDGLARTMRPSHTFVDGDTLFTLSTNKIEVDLNGLSMLAVSVVEKAVLRAVKAANTAYGLPAHRDIFKRK